jgi:hypothetical protein
MWLIVSTIELVAHTKWCNISLTSTGAAAAFALASPAAEPLHDEGTLLAASAIFSASPERIAWLTISLGIRGGAISNTLWTLVYWWYPNLASGWAFKTSIKPSPVIISPLMWTATTRPITMSEQPTREFPGTWIMLQVLHSYWIGDSATRGGRTSLEGAFVTFEIGNSSSHVSREEALTLSRREYLVKYCQL